MDVPQYVTKLVGIFTADVVSMSRLATALSYFRRRKEIKVSSMNILRSFENGFVVSYIMLFHNTVKPIAGVYFLEIRKKI